MLMNPHRNLQQLIVSIELEIIIKHYTAIETKTYFIREACTFNVFALCIDEVKA